MQTRTLRLAAAAMALSAATACAMPPAPSSRSSSGAPLEIRGTTLMMVGGRGRLTAWQVSDGEAREVSAEWTAQGDAISITRNGVMVAQRLGKATARASYAGLTATEIVHVVTGVAGTWRGSVDVVDCWQSTVTSPDPCESRRGLTAPLLLTVSQSAAAELGNLTGTIAIFAPAARGSFVGLLDSEGTFFVQGHVERPEDGLQTAVSFRWQLDGETLVPMKIDDWIDDTISVLLSLRSHVTFSEIWKMSTLTR